MVSTKEILMFGSNVVVLSCDGKISLRLKVGPVTNWASLSVILESY